MIINWESYFDHIFCLHYAGYNDRLLRIKTELQRVQLLNNKIFSFHNTINSYYNKFIIQNLNYDDQHFKNSGYFDCQYGHYEILCESLLMNYNRILVIEDDVVFLKDLTNIFNIIKNIPSEADLILYDYWEYDQLNNIRSGNNKKDLYLPLFEKNILNRYHSSSLYSMNSKYIKIYKNELEKKFYPFDQLWNIIKNSNNLNVFKSNIHIGIQKDFSNSLSKQFWNSTAENIYIKQGLDLKTYSTY